MSTYARGRSTSEPIGPQIFDRVQYVIGLEATGGSSSLVDGVLPLVMPLALRDRYKTVVVASGFSRAALRRSRILSRTRQREALRETARQYLAELMVNIPWLEQMAWEQALEWGFQARRFEPLLHEASVGTHLVFCALTVNDQVYDTERFVQNWTRLLRRRLRVEKPFLDGLEAGEV